MEKRGPLCVHEFYQMFILSIANISIRVVTYGDSLTQYVDGCGHVTYPLRV